MRRTRLLTKTGAAGLLAVLGMGVGCAQVYGGSGANAAHPDGAPQPSGAVGDNRLGTFDGSSGRIEASSQDKAFLSAAAQEGSFEVEAARLAMERSGSEDVKQFARQMAADHADLSAQLQPVAAVAGVKPPKDLAKKDKAAYGRLQGLSGDAFDRAYIEAMVGHHSEDLRAFQMEASHGQLPSAKTAASQDTSFLSAHLEGARQLAQAHGVDSGKVGR